MAWLFIGSGIGTPRLNKNQILEVYANEQNVLEVLGSNFRDTNKAGRADNDDGYVVVIYDENDPADQTLDTDEFVNSIFEGDTGELVKGYWLFKADAEAPLEKRNFRLKKPNLLYRDQVTPADNLRVSSNTVELNVIYSKPQVTNVTYNDPEDFYTREIPYIPSVVNALSFAVDNDNALDLADLYYITQQRIQVSSDCTSIHLTEDDAGLIPVTYTGTLEVTLINPDETTIIYTLTEGDYTFATSQEGYHTLVIRALNSGDEPTVYLSPIYICCYDVDSKLIKTDMTVLVPSGEGTSLTVEGVGFMNVLEKDDYPIQDLIRNYLVEGNPETSNLTALESSNRVVNKKAEYTFTGLPVVEDDVYDIYLEKTSGAGVTKVSYTVSASDSTLEDIIDGLIVSLVTEGGFTTRYAISRVGEVLDIVGLYSSTPIPTPLKGVTTLLSPDGDTGITNSDLTVAERGELEWGFDLAEGSVDSRSFGLKTDKDMVEHGIEAGPQYRESLNNIILKVGQPRPTLDSAQSFTVEAAQDYKLDLTGNYLTYPDDKDFNIQDDLWLNIIDGTKSELTFSLYTDAGFDMGDISAIDSNSTSMSDTNLSLTEFKLEILNAFDDVAYIIESNLKRSIGVTYLTFQFRNIGDNNNSGNGDIQNNGIDSDIKISIIKIATTEVDSDSSGITLNVVTTKNLNIGDTLYIDKGGVKEETNEIASITEEVSLTLTTPLTYTHLAIDGAKVTSNLLFKVNQPLNSSGSGIFADIRFDVGKNPFWNKRGSVSSVDYSLRWASIRAIFLMMGLNYTTKTPSLLNPIMPLGVEIPSLSKIDSDAFRFLYGGSYSLDAIEVDSSGNIVDTVTTLETTNLHLGSDKTECKWSMCISGDNFYDKTTTTKYYRVTTPEAVSTDLFSLDISAPKPQITTSWIELTSGETNVFNLKGNYFLASETLNKTLSLYSNEIMELIPDYYEFSSNKIMGVSYDVANSPYSKDIITVQNIYGISNSSLYFNVMVPRAVVDLDQLFLLPSVGSNNEIELIGGYYSDTNTLWDAQDYYVEGDLEGITEIIKPTVIVDKETREISKMICTYNTNLSGKYFLISSVDNNYYCWFNVGNSEDPLVKNRVGISIDISSVLDTDALIDKIVDSIPFICTKEGSILEIQTVNSDFFLPLLDGKNYSTGLSFSVNTIGLAPHVEITKIDCIGDINLSLQGKYFNISSSNIDYYVWYQVDLGDQDPQPSTSSNTFIGVEVIIDENDTSDTIATLTKNAIDSLFNFGASVSSDIITISRTTTGELPNSLAETSGFSVTTSVEGTTGTIVSANITLISVDFSNYLGKYFTIDHPEQKYYIWFDSLDFPRVDPKILNRDSIVVYIESNWDSDWVVLAIKDALEYTDRFSCSVSGLIVEVDSKDSKFALKTLTNGDLGSFITTTNGIPDNNAITEETQVVCVADSSNSLSKKYWKLNSVEGIYYIWYTVIVASKDPLVYGRTSIKIDISKNDTSTLVASKTNIILDALETFESMIAEDSITLKTVVNAQSNSLPSNATTGFTLTVEQTGSATSTAQSSEIKCDCLNNQYFKISSILNDYIIWYNLDSMGTAPDVLGVSVEVAISSSDDIEGVATKSAMEINALLDFSANSTGSNLSITNVVAGEVNPVDVSNIVFNPQTTTSSVGINSQSEITRFKTISNLDSQLSSKFFNISSTTEDYYIWYNVIESNPAPFGLTEIRVDVFKDDTATTIASTVNSTLNSLTSIFKSEAIADTLIVSNKVSGAVLDAQDGLNNLDTGMQISTTIQGFGTKEISEVSIENRALDGSYFTLNSPTNAYYVWFNVDAQDNNPNIALKTGIAVEVSLTDSSVSVALKLKNTLNLHGSFISSVTNNIVTITNVKGGNVIETSGGDLNDFVHIDTISQGIDLEEEQIQVQCVADSSGSLNGKYFFLNTPTKFFLIWFNVASAEDPLDFINLYNRDAIEVTLNSNDSSIVVAAAIKNALENNENSNPFVSISINNNILIITALAQGELGAVIPSMDSLDRSLTFNITKIANGVDGEEEAFKIVMPSNISNSLSDKYFLMSSESANYYVWFNTGSSTDPSLSGTGIEITLTSDDTHIEVATVVASTINAISGFSASNNNTSQVSIILDNKGVVVDINLGNMLLDSIKMQRLGSEGTSEVTEITCIADVSGSLNNKYFKLFDLHDHYHVWFNVSSGGMEPMVPDSFGKSSVGIEIAISINDSAAAIASVISTAINSKLTCSTNVSSEVIIITVNQGVILDHFRDQNSGIGISTITNGTNGITAKFRIYMLNTNITDGGYIEFYAPSHSDANGTKYYAWFNKDGIGTDPNPSGYDHGISMEYDSMDRQQDLALIIKESLSGYEGFYGAVFYTEIISDTIIEVSCIYGGTVSDAIEVNSNILPYGVLNQGINPVKESSTILCNEDVSVGSTFFIADPINLFYVWYKKDSVGVDPLFKDQIGLLVEILSTDTSDQIALKTSTVLNNNSNFSTSLSSSTITLTNTNFGSSRDVTNYYNTHTGMVIQSLHMGVNAVCGESTLKMLNLNSSSFNIYAPNNIFYVWYNVLGASSIEPTTVGEGVQIDITENATSEEVAFATKNAIDSLTNFSASVLDSVITITNTITGDTIDIIDSPIAEYATNFNISNFIQGDGLTQEVTNITCLEDLSSSLSGKFFRLHTVSFKHHIWFNVDSQGVEPIIMDSTGLEIAITSDQDMNSIANSIAIRISLESNFISTYLTNIITINNVDYGVSSNAQSGTSLFNIIINSEGVNPENEITQLVCVADDTLSLKGKYFTINSVDTSYYVWFNVDAGTQDPNVSSRVGIQVDIIVNDSRSTIGLKTATILNNHVDFNAVNSESVVTFFCKTQGVVLNSPSKETSGIEGLVLVQNGAVNIAQSTIIDCCILNNKYFLISDADVDYYIWFNTNNQGEDPRENSMNGRSINLDSTVTMDSLAIALKDTINGLDNMVATSSGNTIMIENSTAGVSNFPRDIDGRTQFECTTLQSGLKPTGSKLNWEIQIDSTAKKNIRSLYVKKTSDPNFILPFSMKLGLGSKVKICDEIETENSIFLDLKIDIKVGSLREGDLTFYKDLDILESPSLTNGFLEIFNLSSSQSKIIDIEKNGYLITDDLYDGFLIEGTNSLRILGRRKDKDIVTSCSSLWLKITFSDIILNPILYESILIIPSSSDVITTDTLFEKELECYIPLNHKSLMLSEFSTELTIPSIVGYIEVTYTNDLGDIFTGRILEQDINGVPIGEQNILSNVFTITSGKAIFNFKGIKQINEEGSYSELNIHIYTDSLLDEEVFSYIRNKKNHYDVITGDIITIPLDMKNVYDINGDLTNISTISTTLLNITSNFSNTLKWVFDSTNETNFFEPKTFKVTNNALDSLNSFTIDYAQSKPIIIENQIYSIVSGEDGQSLSILGSNFQMGLGLLSHPFGTTTVSFEKVDETSAIWIINSDARSFEQEYLIKLMNIEGTASENSFTLKLQIAKPIIDSSQTFNNSQAGELSSIVIKGTFFKQAVDSYSIIGDTNDLVTYNIVVDSPDASGMGNSITWTFHSDDQANLIDRTLNVNSNSGESIEFFGLTLTEPKPIINALSSFYVPAGIETSIVVNGEHLDLASLTVNGSKTNIISEVIESITSTSFNWKITTSANITIENRSFNISNTNGTSNNTFEITVFSVPTIETQSVSKTPGVNRIITFTGTNLLSESTSLIGETLLMGETVSDLISDFNYSYIEVNSAGTQLTWTFSYIGSGFNRNFKFKTHFGETVSFNLLIGNPLKIYTNQVVYATAGESNNVLIRGANLAVTSPVIVIGGSTTNISSETYDIISHNKFGWNFDITSDTITNSNYNLINTLGTSVTSFNLKAYTKPNVSTIILYVLSGTTQNVIIVGSHFVSSSTTDITGVTSISGDTTGLGTNYSVTKDDGTEITWDINYLGSWIQRDFTLESNYGESNDFTLIVAGKPELDLGQVVYGTVGGSYSVELTGSNFATGFPILEISTLESLAGYISSSTFSIINDTRIKWDYTIDSGATIIDEVFHLKNNMGQSTNVLSLQVQSIPTISSPIIVNKISGTSLEFIVIGTNFVGSSTSPFIGTTVPILPLGQEFKFTNSSTVVNSAGTELIWTFDVDYDFDDDIWFKTDYGTTEDSIVLFIQPRVIIEPNQVVRVASDKITMDKVLSGTNFRQGLIFKYTSTQSILTAQNLIDTNVIYEELKLSLISKLDNTNELFFNVESLERRNDSISYTGLKVANYPSGGDSLNSFSLIVGPYTPEVSLNQEYFNINIDSINEVTIFGNFASGDTIQIQGDTGITTHSLIKSGTLNAEGGYPELIWNFTPSMDIDTEFFDLNVHSSLTGTTSLNSFIFNIALRTPYLENSLNFKCGSSGLQDKITFYNTKFIKDGVVIYGDKTDITNEFINILDNNTFEWFFTLTNNVIISNRILYIRNSAGNSDNAFSFNCCGKPNSVRDMILIQRSSGTLNNFKITGENFLNSNHPTLIGITRAYLVFTTYEVGLTVSHININGSMITLSGYSFSESNDYIIRLENEYDISSFTLKLILDQPCLFRSGSTGTEGCIWPIIMNQPSGSTSENFEQEYPDLPDEIVLGSCDTTYQNVLKNSLETFTEDRPSRNYSTYINTIDVLGIGNSKIKIFITLYRLGRRTPFRLELELKDNLNNHIIGSIFLDITPKLCDFYVNPGQAFLSLEDDSSLLIEGEFPIENLENDYFLNPLKESNVPIKYLKGSLWKTDAEARMVYNIPTDTDSFLKRNTKRNFIQKSYSTLLNVNERGVATYLEVPLLKLENEIENLSMDLKIESISSRVSSSSNLSLSYPYKAPSIEISLEDGFYSVTTTTTTTTSSSFFGCINKYTFIRFKILFYEKGIDDLLQNYVMDKFVSTNDSFLGEIHSHMYGWKGELTRTLSYSGFAETSTSPPAFLSVYNELYRTSYDSMQMCFNLMIKNNLKSFDEVYPHNMCVRLKLKRKAI